MTRKNLYLSILFLGIHFLALGQHINKRPSLIDLHEIKEITIFYPVTKIEVVGKGMEQLHYDSASLVSAALNLDILYENKAIFEQTYFFPKEEIQAYDFFSLDLMDLADRAAKGFQFQDLRITPTLYQLMEETTTRFCMLVYHDGFVRKKGNIVGEMFKSIGIGVATMGNYAPVPVSYASNVFLFIMDKELGHAVFAKKYEGDEIHPLKKKTLAKQYKYLLKDFN
jgi:hypothetical protein